MVLHKRFLDVKIRFMPFVFRCFGKNNCKTLKVYHKSVIIPTKEQPMLLAENEALGSNSQQDKVILNNSRILKATKLRFDIQIQ